MGVAPAVAPPAVTKGGRMKMLTNCLALRLAFAPLVALLLGVGGCGNNEKDDASDALRTHSADAEAPELSREVRRVLQMRMALVSTLAADPLIVDAVAACNRDNADLPHADIVRLDAAWQEATGLNEFMRSLLTNECAEYLLDFQEANDGFPEIFITDQKGLIVATTNRTSDYYQADEDWWVRGYDAGRGRSYYGELEYDESAHAEAIAIYVPVRDPGTARAIGVIKAVCDVTAIKLEL
jgi:hypothetical protein